jgi:hypothetical protein
MSWNEYEVEVSRQSVAVLSTVGIILFVLVLSGPVGGVDFTGEPTTLDDGNASVTVAEGSTDTLTVSEGRFGTNVTYVRIPDAVLDVESVRGQPRVVYLVTVPNLSVDKQSRRYIESTGRLTVPMSDRALPNRPAAGTYEGRMVIRVQSFGYDEVVLNRSVEVTVE